ncbi:MAG: hypothetical protein H6590_09110 [Flavobacteriales bacterium]|nr:hypothetical protein [Flavobacteriales bacterium]
MTTNAEDELIQKAILEKRRLLLTVEHGFGDAIEIRFDPYIYGQDTWQRYFVWGLDSSLHCYKYYLDWVKKVKLEGGQFKVDPNAVYYYSMDEEHYACVENPEVVHQAYSHIDGRPVDDVAAAILKRKD